MLPNTSPVNRLALAVALCTALAGPGCFHTENDELTSAVVGGEKPVAMEGGDTFFDGKIAVKVTLSRGIGRGLGSPARRATTPTRTTPRTRTSRCWAARCPP